MKKFKYLLYSLLLFTFMSNVDALMMKDTEIPAESWLVGTHLFTTEKNTTSGYSGAITTPFVMYAASSIESDSLDEMIIYYKIDDGYWYDYLDPDFNIIERDPSDEYLITHRNGVCVDPSCDFTGDYDYTITFNQLEDELKSIKVHHGNKISSDDIYTFEERPGYEMLCWYDVDVYGVSGTFNEDMCFDFDTKITKNYNLNVMWSINSYKVKYDLNGGTLNEEDATGDDFDEIKTNLLDGQVCFIKSDNNKSLNCSFVETDKLVKDGYKFVGWSLNKDGEQYFEPGSDMRYLGTEENVTLYAVWKPEDKNISYDLDGGYFDGDLPSNKVEYGSTISSINVVPKKEFYKFKQWYYLDGNKKVYLEEQELVVKGDVTLYAEWEAASYTVNYIIDGKAAGKKTGCKYGSTCSLGNHNPSLVPDNYRLVGWSLAEDYGSFYTTDATSNNICEYNATFNEDGTYQCNLYGVLSFTRNITYVLNDGEWEDGTAVPKELAYGESTFLPTPVKYGCIFMGWDVSTSFVKIHYDELVNSYYFVLTVNEDITLTAKWAEEYNVEVYSNGGFYATSGTSVGPVFDYPVAGGSEFEFPTDLAKDGYRISYWLAYGETIFKDDVVYYVKNSVSNGETFTGIDENAKEQTDFLCPKEECIYYTEVSNPLFDLETTYYYGTENQQGGFMLGVVDYYTGEGLNFVGKQEGSSIVVNQDLILIPIWEETDSYSITYMFNGTDITDELTNFPKTFKVEDSSITLPARKDILEKYSSISGYYNETYHPYGGNRYENDDDTIDIAVKQIDTIINFTISENPPTTTG